MAAPTIAKGGSASRYSPKGDLYRADDGVQYRTLPRRRAGWEHILAVHERRASKETA